MCSVAHVGTCRIQQCILPHSEPVDKHPAMDSLRSSLAECHQYLEQLRAVSDTGVFDRIVAQQFTSWKNRLQKMKVGHSVAMELMNDIQEGPWTAQQKGELLETVQPAEEEEAKGKLRNRQQCFTFHDFLTPTDVESLQKGQLYTRLQTVARRMVLITLHLPNEPTCGHVLEFLGLEFRMGYGQGWAGTCFHLTLIGIPWLPLTRLSRLE